MSVVEAGVPGGRFATLDGWLQWQQTLHPRAIDLGLDRVRQVAERLGVLRPACPVITVGGTNGKGSCVTYLDAILSAAGYRVGVYTSPHLVRYNERVRVGGREATDAELVEAFERIDQARGGTSLTYFEFGTLAAFDLFSRSSCDVWILEVGLGGRLDAVNVVDADVAVLTSISLDHTDWLGPDREAIGREKAGIFRAGRVAVYGERNMPASVADVAAAVGAKLRQVGRDYDFSAASEHWLFTGSDGVQQTLPLPALIGDHQLANAAAALAALQALSDRLPVRLEAVQTGLACASLAGRFQVLPGAVEWILDVAHNQDGVACLARTLGERQISGRCHAVFAQMRRKELWPVVSSIAGLIDDWWLLDLPDEDARPAVEVGAELRRMGEQVRAEAGAADLFDAVGAAAAPGDRVVVFGSFRTVEEALRHRMRVPEEE